MNAIDDSGVSSDETWEFGGHQFTGLMYGGWLGDVPDRRDRPLFPQVGKSVVAGAETAPDGLDLADPDPEADLAVDWREPVLQQRPLRSCVSCAVASVVGHLDRRGRVVTGPAPSTLFLYYHARELDGSGPCDNGSTIRGALKGLNRYGVCTDRAWSGVQFVQRPTAQAYANASYAGTASYRRVFRIGQEPDELDLTPVRRALANGLPVVFGFSVFESFRAAGRGEQVPLPGPGDRVLFGHAAVLIGYDGRNRTYTAVNSWGREWGDEGRFHLPAAYLADRRLAKDFWVIDSLGDSAARRAAGPSLTAS